jgi:PAS domain S-box-containing protein
MATILIVDDLAANRHFLVTLLRYKGHHIIEARDGAEALARARAERPALVITDVLMPVMDGYELLRQLRQDPATASIPIVFYTAHYAEAEARELARSSGVFHVLTKPSEPQDVLRTVDEVLAQPPEAPGPVAATPVEAFDRDHLRLVTDKLSDKVGELSAANARLRALVQVGLELGSERSSDRLLQAVCSAAAELVGGTHVTLGVVSRENGRFERLVTAGEGAGDWIAAGDAVPGVLQAVVSERQVTHGVNPGGDPGALGLPPGHPPIHAYVAAPVASPAHVYGWLCVINNEGRALDGEDERIVAALSGQVGRIYENGYFYAIAQRRAEELEREIIERQRATEALQQAEERIRFALEAAGVGIWDLDYTTGALRWSEILEAQHGLAPGTFRGTFDAFLETVHPDDRQALADTLSKARRSGADFSTLHRTVWPDGSVHWISGSGRLYFDDAGRMLRSVGVSMDVTARRTLEQQYQQAQKMEAVGRLAGGLAHDFNNLLTAILGYCELLLDDLDPRDRRRADVEQILHAGVTAGALTRQLLAFSRKQIIEPADLNLNTIITELLEMLRRLIGEDIEIVLALEPGLGLALVDRGQVEQVILNLAVNARDAMPGGGTLMIETARVRIEDDYAATHPAMQPGEYICLTMSDTGTGMTPEVQAHLFEPFFTTKEPGKGTGLGLATVYGIVTQVGGSVRVYTEPGRGSTFNVYFPKVEAADATAARPAAANGRSTAGSETILVVEDDAGLRELARRILQRQGYTVLLASDAAEAVRLCDGDIAIDVLLTDVVMPGASGPELTARLTVTRPRMKVVYMSGYTEESIVRHGVLKEGIAFLHKPFTSAAIAQKIRDALDG